MTAILAATRARWAATITHDAPAAARLWHQLETRLTGGHGTTGQRGAPGPRYPSFEAIHARTLIRETLTYWCQTITHTWHVALPDEAPTNMGAHIALYAPRIAESAYAGACAEQIHEVATGWAWRVCYPTGTRIVPIGRRCPQDGCDGKVRAIVRPDDAPRDTELACDTCHHVWPLHTWHTYPRRAA